MKQNIIRIRKNSLSSSNLPLQSSSSSTSSIPKLSTTYRIKHECNSGICCLCFVESSDFAQQAIAQILKFQSNRITQGEIFLYIDFIRECYGFFVKRKDDEQYRNLCISLALSLLLRAFSMEKFRTKRQKYSISAACLMLSLNCFIDEHKVIYSAMICFHPSLQDSTPKYLAECERKLLKMFDYNLGLLLLLKEQ